MDTDTRSFMESRFGYDFKDVRVHNDSLAHRSSAEVGALAYAHGNHVVFGAGKYHPKSDSGKQLLAHELAHVIQQKRNNFLSPVINRATESKEFPQKDRSVIIVGRNIVPGNCKLFPKTQTRTAADITASNAFIQFDFCRGSYGGQVSGDLNYGDAINDAATAAKDFFNTVGRGGDPKQALQVFEQALSQVTPDANVQFNFQSQDFRFRIGATGEASKQGGASGESSVSAEVDIGPVAVGVEGQVRGGTQEDTSGRVLIVIKNADKGPPPADCRVCNCSKPKITYWCSRKGTPGSKTPEIDLKPKIVPVYFKYQKTVPREGWEKTYDAMLLEVINFIGQGYTIEKIEGNASPEGPMQRRKGSNFENRELSKKRAIEAWQDLRKEIEPRLDAELGFRKQELRTAYNSSPQIVGLGEVFGSSGTKEVPDDKLFEHITKLDKEAKDKGQDVFAENRVTGEDLPEAIGKENQQYVDQFRTGTQETGTQKLRKAERLESLYNTLRRALIYLVPPAKKEKKFDARKAGEEAAKAAEGEPIECTEAHLKLLNDALPFKNNLLEGECKEGEETKRFPRD